MRQKRFKQKLLWMIFCDLLISCGSTVFAVEPPFSMIEVEEEYALCAPGQVLFLEDCCMIASEGESGKTEVLREEITAYALKFVGNPYVWGGTSLTEGADCSGFVQSLYADFGFTLPRVAKDQAQCGTRIPVDKARPGDLIFYERDGLIYHVVMYLGDGKTVEAANSEEGIVCSEVNTERAMCAVCILSEP